MSISTTEAAVVVWLTGANAGWLAEHWDSAKKMFHWDGMHDGMEVNINSRLTTDEGSGADGYRPTINSYLFAAYRLARLFVKSF